MADKPQKWFKERLTDALSKADQKKLNLKPYPRSILNAIAKFADANGFAWPSTDQIEKETGIPARHQCRYFKILKSRKFLSIKRKYCKEPKPMTRNYYTINLNAVLELTIDQNGEIKTAISDLKSQCIKIEPNPNMGDGSKSVRPTSNPVVARSEGGRTEIEPNPTVGCKLDITNKLDKELLDIVQQKALDVIKPTYGFDEFWLAYPRKEKKKDAYRIWMREGLTAKAEKILMDLHDRKTRHDRWEDVRYIPLPSTYLNNEQWEDQIVDRSNQEKTTASSSLTQHQSNIISIADEFENAWRKKNGSLS